MPRSHGRIMAAIWKDPDFIAMRGSAQRMFMFLLSQDDLSHAGLVPMRVRRWAQKAEDATPDSIEGDLAYLSDRRFVVLDHDTEELLIRTFVRNDGVYKQPKVMLRLREDARQIESPRLRSAFRVELDRLPLDELNDEASNAAARSTRRQVSDVVDTLRADFEDATGYPSEGVSDTHPDTPRVRAGAFHLPPTPVPQPPSTSHQPPSPAAPSAEPRAPRSETEPTRFDEFWDTYDHKVGRKKAETAYRAALKKPGVTEDRLIVAAASYIDFQRREGKHPQFTKHATSWLHGEHWTDERIDRQPPPTRVQEHLSLVEQLAAEEAEQERRAIGGGR